MHNNYFFLKQLSLELSQKLQGYSVVSCFSQDKDELVLEFNNTVNSFFIKAHLKADFCCLFFPTSFSRSRKNSVDLLNDILLKEVKSILQFKNERSFALIFSDDLVLLFKMHGNQSNILLFRNEIPIAIFRNHLKNDYTIKLNALDRPIDWSLENFVKNRESLSKTFVTFNNAMWEYLDALGFQSSDIQKQWEIFQNFRSQLNTGEFYISTNEKSTTLSLYPIDGYQKKYTSPVEAINEFFLQRVKSGSIDIEQKKILKQIIEKEKQTSRYISKNKTLLHSLEETQQYKLWADLIMANLQSIKKGMEKVTLEDYLNPGHSVEIKLKRDLSAQKNAEVFYRKAKNQSIEIDQITKSLEAKETELKNLQNLKSEIEASEDLGALKKLLTGTKTDITSQKDSIRLPFHELEIKHFVIRVGKNAKDNDELTLKYAHKNDLWLHAKDVSGSHVIVKHQSGKDFPKEVIERAAELAAFHSKRKGDSLCPVIVTQKKFVRKRKGDPEGLVVVEKEKVIMVEPKGF